MKILLISDTHGHIDRISEYMKAEKTDLCIHAGDFGFYDADSVKALTQKELYLQIKHSDLPDKDKATLLKADTKTRQKAIEKNSLLGNFVDHLSGKLRFDRPIYAVWGNHDDAEVVLRMIQSPIPNLNILSDKSCFDIGSFALLGLGGNCMLNGAFVQGCQGLPGARCRPTSTLPQYLSLLRTTCGVVPEKPKILVTHVSPMVEPFLELLAWRIGATLTISGHMGYPNGEIGKTDISRMSFLQAEFKTLLRLYPKNSAELETLRPTANNQTITHINLPDAKDGYALLYLNGTEFKVEMYGQSHSRQSLCFPVPSPH